MEHASTLPIGEKRLITDTQFIKVYQTRTSAEYLTLEYLEPVHRKLVLKCRMGIYTASVELEYADREYWNILVNGKPAIPGEIIAWVGFSADPETRTLKVGIGS